MKGANKMSRDIPFRKEIIHQNRNSHSQFMLETLNFSSVRGRLLHHVAPIVPESYTLSFLCQMATKTTLNAESSE